MTNEMYVAALGICVLLLMVCVFLVWRMVKAQGAEIDIVHNRCNEQGIRWNEMRQQVDRNTRWLEQDLEQIREEHDEYRDKITQIKEKVALMEGGGDESS